ncbi:TPR repeat containing protein [Candidatus Magnetomorum sp. HK-1]|nr:TPR repeat containing protein [Candidatus Magnetomorum sp. HK-1]
MRKILFQLLWGFIIILTLFNDNSKAFQMTREFAAPQKSTSISHEKMFLFKPLILKIDTTVHFNLAQKSQADPQKTNDFENADGLINIKQMDLIQARILSRKGLYPRSKQLYQKVLARYPQSLEVRADYAEVLVENGDYDAAYYEIKYLLSQNATDLRGLRILASLYDRLELYTWSFPIYESLLGQYPDDAGIWFDYANQRQMAGHWQKALNAYERVLEKDPDNLYALRGIHSILQNKRPKFKTHFFSNKSSDGTIQNDQQYNFQYTLTQEMAFHAIFENIEMITPDNINIDNKTIQQTSLEVSYDFYPRVKLIGRYTNYQGIGNGTCEYAALEYKKNLNTEFKITCVHHAPWFDPVQAMDLDGSYDEYQIEYITSIAKEIRINTLFSYKNYAINRISNYGSRSHFHIGLSKRLWIKPDTSLSLSMDQAEFQYGSKNQSVPMVLNENVYTLSTYLYDQPCKALFYYLSIGYRWDIHRSLAGFFVHPGVNLSLTSRFKITTSYAYSSESTGVTRGSTQSIQMDINIIF